MHESSSCGLLHSEICGSKLAYSSPQLIAVNHVLHRLPMPRHSPCAIFRFTFRVQVLLLLELWGFSKDFSFESLATFVTRLKFWNVSISLFDVVFCTFVHHVVSSFSHYTCYSVFKVLRNCKQFLLFWFRTDFRSFSFWKASQICFEWNHCVMKLLRSEILRMKSSLRSDSNTKNLFVFEWAKVDSNHRPHAYQACALTGWAIGPFPWRWGESNPWPPACKAGALPAELHPRLRLYPVFSQGAYWTAPSKLNNARFQNS